MFTEKEYIYLSSSIGLYLFDIRVMVDTMVDFYLEKLQITSTNEHNLNKTEVAVLSCSI